MYKHLEYQFTAWYLDWYVCWNLILFQALYVITLGRNCQLDYAEKSPYFIIYSYEELQCLGKIHLWLSWCLVTWSPDPKAYAKWCVDNSSTLRQAFISSSWETHQRSLGVCNQYGIFRQESQIFHYRRENECGIIWLSSQALKRIIAVFLEIVMWLWKRCISTSCGTCTDVSLSKLKQYV